MQLENMYLNLLQPGVAFPVPTENIRKPINTGNIRKPKGFLMFSVGTEKQHRAVMG